jgi:hypothetical protein
MKRDMDIVRKIIFAVRDSSESVDNVPEIPPNVFAYHAQILQEAGMVEAALLPDNGNQPAIKAIVFRLTWNGQDFADAASDDTIWKKAKDKILKPATSWTFAILLEYLKAETKAKLGL